MNYFELKNIYNQFVCVRPLPRTALIIVSATPEIAEDESAATAIPFKIIGIHVIIGEKPPVGFSI